MSAPVFRCTACCAPTGQPHADGCQAESADGWHVFANPPAATIHTRLVGGVLCRWWGDGPVPPGVALIDAAARPAVVSEGPVADNQPWNALSLMLDTFERPIGMYANERKACDLARIALARPAAPAPEAPADELHKDFCQKCWKVHASVDCAPEAPTAAQAPEVAVVDLSMLRRFSHYANETDMVPDSDGDWVAFDNIEQLSALLATQPKAAPVAEAPTDLTERQKAVMLHDFPKLSEFFHKHALGPMLAPSCLVCGCLPLAVAIQHGELPGIVVCASCRDKVAAPATEQAKETLTQAVERTGSLLAAANAMDQQQASPAAPDDEPDLDGALLQKILDAYARRFPAHIGCSASEVVDEVVRLIGKKRL